MKDNRTPKTKRSTHPLEKRLDLRISFTEEEILADLRYPAPVRRLRQGR